MIRAKKWPLFAKIGQNLALIKWAVLARVIRAKKRHIFEKYVKMGRGTDSVRASAMVNHALF